MRILSLGAGVQSTTLALMSETGDLPYLDAAIFADTRGEPRYVYEHLDRLYDAISYPVYVVSAGDLAGALTGPGRFATIPYFTLSAAGERGMGRRQCTREYKVEPINRKARELLGINPMGRPPRDVVAEQWIGFSADEVGRVSDKHRVAYLAPRYPLIELGMTREDCRRWLAEHDWPEVAKSACSFCPYRSNAEWRALRDEHPEDWRHAVEVDAAIRHGGAGGSKTLDGMAFLHEARVPLPLAPIDDDDNLGDPDGCSPYGCRSGSRVA